jgi:hypothetical protein
MVSSPEVDTEPPFSALVDLLGALAYAQLSAFDRLAADASLAPTLGGRAEMSEMAGREIRSYRRLADRILELGARPEQAMEPFVAAIESFHALTQPTTWLEAVVKAYVGDGIAADFYREIAHLVDAGTAELITEAVADEPRAQFAVREVRAGLAQDPDLAGRLALWARRLVGEAISQTQYVLAEREALVRLLVAGPADLGRVADLITRITARHDERMRALGLA